MTVLRVYEAAGKPAQRVRVTFYCGIQQVQEANLIEDPGAHIRGNADGFTFDLRPFEIKTFKFKLEATSHVRDGDR